MHDEEELPQEFTAEELELQRALLAPRASSHGSGAPAMPCGEEVLLARYLDGSLSSEERAQTEEALSQRADLRSLLVGLHADVYSITSSLPNEETVAEHVKQEIVRFAPDDKINRIPSHSEPCDTENIVLQEFMRLRASG